MPFKGDLSALGLADVFQTLHLGSKEGVLVISDGDREKRIRFSPSGVSLLSTGPRQGIGLGEFLVRAGKLTPEQLQAAVKEHPDQKVSTVLVEKGILTPEDIQQAIRGQIEDEIYDLFFWHNATYEFLEGAGEEGSGMETIVRRVAFDVNSILMEAMRRQDEWKVITGRVPNLSVIPALKDPALAQAPQTDWMLGKILPLIDGRRSVDEILQASHLGSFDVCRIVSDLVGSEQARLLPAEETTIRARELIVAGQTAEGLSLLQKVARFNPGVELLQELAGRLLKAGDRVGAARNHREAGDLLSKQGHDNDALASYRAATEANPDDLTSARRIFEVLTGLKRAQEASAAGRSLVQKAVAAANFDLARTVSEELLRADPNDQQAHLAFASVHQAQGNAEAAMSEVEHVLRTLPADLLQQVTVLRQILQAVPDHPQAVNLLDHAELRLKVNARSRMMKLVLAGGAAVLLVAGGAIVMVLNTTGAGPSEGKVIVVKVPAVAATAPTVPAPATTASGTAAPAPPTDPVAAAAAATEDKARAEREAAETAAREAAEAEAKARAERERAEREAGEKAAREAAEADIARTLERIRQDEAEGQYGRACRTVQDLKRRHPADPRVAEFGYPLRIETVPPEATVYHNRVDAGRSPLTLRWSGAGSLPLRFERPGYEPLAKAVTNPLEGRIEVVLSKTWAWRFKAGGVFEAGAPLVLSDGTTVFGCRDGKLYALDAAGAARWVFAADVGGDILSTPRPAGGLLIVGSNDGNVYGVDPARPEKAAWTFRVGSFVRSSAAVSPDASRAYIGASDRKLYALDAKTGVKISDLQAPGEIGGPVLLAGDRVIAACDDGSVLAAVPPPGGDGEGADAFAVAWTAKAGGPIRGGAVRAGDLVVVGCADAGVRAFRIADGAKAWEAKTDGEIVGTPCAEGDRVFVGSRDGRLHAFAAADGSVRWTFAAGGPISGSPVADGGVLYVGSEDQSLYALDAATGKLLWKLAVDGKIRTAPAVNGRFILFGSDDRHVYAVSRD